MRWLRSWFVRTTEIPKDPEKKKELLGFLMDLVLAFIFGLVEMPVLCRWAGWFLCFCILLYIVQSSIQRIGEYPRKTRILGRMVIAMVFVGAFYPLAYGQLETEKASTLSGELCSFRSFWGTCYTPPIPIIEIADSGTKFIWGGQNAMQMGTFANNVDLRIEQGRHGIELSTPLLDSSGKKITNIEKNHWTVIPPPGIWDKNYTQNSLEIKGSRGQVVLQLKYLPDRIQIAVEWRDQFGRGQEWSRCGSHSCISPWGSPQTELQNEIVIEPIFKYPSSEHLGKFVN